MYRRTFTAALPLAVIFRPAASQAVEPLELFHYEISPNYYDVTEKRIMSTFEWQMVSNAALWESHNLSGRDDNLDHHYRTFAMLKAAKRLNIPLNIEYEIQPSAYYEDFRKVVYFARSLDPERQVLLSSLWHSDVAG